MSGHYHKHCDRESENGASHEDNSLKGKTCKLGMLTAVYARICLTFISCVSSLCTKRAGEDVMEGTNVDLGADNMGADSTL